MKDTQLTLPFSLSEESLRRLIEKVSGLKISLTITDNSTCMISARPKGGALSLRLHRMFLRADSALVREMAAFLRGRKTKTPLIKAFIGLYGGMLKEGRPRRRLLKTGGRFHDLRVLSESVNREHFGGRVTAEITWGTRQRGRRYVRRRTLGSYSVHTDTIRISPVLDMRGVPAVFLRFIIYHEMLHAVMGTTLQKGRRSVHPAGFRKREKEFKEFEEAMAWGENLYIM